MQRLISSTSPSPPPCTLLQLTLSPALLLMLWDSEPHLALQRPVQSPQRGLNTRMYPKKLISGTSYLVHAEMEGCCCQRKGQMPKVNLSRPLVSHVCHCLPFLHSQYNTGLPLGSASTGT